MAAVISTRVVPSAGLAAESPRAIAREFRARLAAGLELRVAGEARDEPLALVSGAYAPRARIDLFDSVYYLSRTRQNPDIRFFVAYVIADRNARRPQVNARIFYKDVSLIWRSASHVIRSDDENWIGKGEVRPDPENPEQTFSAEETTDLPYEIQTALELASRSQRGIPRDDRALALVLRRAPDDRTEPYDDFSRPRRVAAANPRNLVNRGRPIARFTRKLDPSSLRFTSGFEPDFARPPLETHRSQSRLYGGKLRRFRILSKNEKAQYLFFAGPRQVWIIPPQATTTQISSYGVRTIDVIAPEDLCIPGYEYHFMDESQDPPELVSQIPAGYAGKPAKADPARADASPWLDELPIIREFRRKVLGRSP